MSERVMPRDALVEMTEVTNQASSFTVYNPDTDKNDRIEKGNLNLDGIRLNASRIADKELTSGSLAVSGWHTIAETGVTANRSRGCNIKISAFGGSSRREFIEFKASIVSEASARTHSNTTIEILERSMAVSGSFRILGARLCKSDSVAGSGQLLQVNLVIASTMVIVSQISNNLADQNDAGFSLVTPVLDATPTLPDGVTAATFLNAGEEQTFETSSTVYFPNWIGSKSTNDQLRCSVEWPEIPMQGTGLTITLPTTLFARDGDGTGVTISVAHTISNFAVAGKHVVFFINETGVFTTLNGGPIAILVSGSGCKLTIT